MRPSLALALLALSVLAGCGGSARSASSGPARSTRSISGARVAEMLEHETNVFQVRCARDGKSGRRYLCKAKHYGVDESRVNLVVTVSGSGDGYSVERCETVKEVAPGKTDPCTEIH